VITYEYPFNERIRTLLRLEDLFDKTAHFMQADGAQEHHVALTTLFEILEVAGRADLKMDLIQELERQRQTLLAYRNNPDISEEALSGALYEIEQASAALLSMTGKIGQYLRENEWLMNIRSRAAIPGGVCEFDLPSYHYWLHRSAEARQADLRGWIGPMTPIREGLAIVLRLLRASGRPEHLVAHRGERLPDDARRQRDADGSRLPQAERQLRPRNQRQQVRAEHPFRPRRRRPQAASLRHRCRFRHDFL